MGSAAAEIMEQSADVFRQFPMLATARTSLLGVKDRVVMAFLIPAITAVESAQTRHHAGRMPRLSVIDNRSTVMVEDEVTAGNTGLFAAIDNLLKFWRQRNDSRLFNLGDACGDVDSIAIKVWPAELPDLIRP